MSGDSGDRDVISSEELREHAVKGARSVAVSRIVFEISAFATMIALTRLIPPAEMGRAAVALVFPMVAVILTFEGFGAALVQRRTMTREHLRTSLTLSVCSGVLLSGALAGFALTVASPVFGGPTADLLLLVSPVFILAGLGTSSRAQLQRRLDFKRISGFEVGAFIVGMVVSLALAVAGADAEALVIGALATHLTETLLMVWAAPPAAPGFSRAALRDIGAYGGFASLSGLAFAVRRNVDYLVLGATMRSDQVGLYYRAYQFGAEYQQKISGILLRVLFPVLARSGSVDDMRAIRARTVSFNAMVVLPLLAVLIGVAPTLVPLVYGGDWVDAVAPTQILAVAGMALALMSGADMLVLALGRPREVMRFNVAFLAVLGVATALASSGGLLAVCWSVVGVHIAMLLLSQYWLLGKVGGLPFRQLFDDAGAAAAASAAVAATALALHHALAGAAPDVVTLAACGLGGLVVYVLVLRVAFPEVLAQLVRLLRRVATPRRRSLETAMVDAAGPAK
jgi:O-antigen/teichoic acid export membrane protein